MELAQHEIGGGIDRTWLLLTSGIIFTMQIGFGLLEAGGVRRKNTGVIFQRIFINCIVVILSWWLVGYAVAYGNSYDRFIGGRLFFAGDGWDFEGNLTTTQYSNWFNNTVMAMLVTSVTNLSLSERITLKASAVHSFFMSIFVYPIILAWTWGGGWLSERRGYHDFAGSGIIFITASYAGLAGLIVLGPRHGRKTAQDVETGRWVQNAGDLANFRERVESQQGESFGVTNIHYTLLGGLLLWFQFAFLAGSNSVVIAGEANWLAAEKAVVNVLLAGSISALLGLLLRFWVLSESEKRTLRESARGVVNGFLAGAVAVLAGCSTYEPWEAVVVGIVACTVYLLAISLFEKIGIDDPLEGFQVYGIAGTVGVGLEAFFNHYNGIFHSDVTEGKVLGNQILGWLVIGAWSFLWSVVIYVALRATGNLRVDLKTEIIGYDYVEYADHISVDTVIRGGKSTARNEDNIYASSPTHKPLSKQNTYIQ